MRSDRDMCHDLTVCAIPQAQGTRELRDAGMRATAMWQAGPADVVWCQARGFKRRHRMPPRGASYGEGMPAKRSCAPVKDCGRAKWRHVAVEVGASADVADGAERADQSGGARWHRSNLS